MLCLPEGSDLTVIWLPCSDMRCICPCWFDGAANDKCLLLDIKMMAKSSRTQQCWGLLCFFSTHNGRAERAKKTLGGQWQLKFSRTRIWFWTCGAQCFATRMQQIPSAHQSSTLLMGRRLLTVENTCKHASTHTDTHSQMFSQQLPIFLQSGFHSSRWPASPRLMGNLLFSSDRLCNYVKDAFSLLHKMPLKHLHPAKGHISATLQYSHTHTGTHTHINFTVNLSLEPAPLSPHPVICRL